MAHCLLVNVIGCVLCACVCAPTHKYVILFFKIPIFNLDEIHLVVTVTAEYGIFFLNQYGFRPKHYTEYAALELIDNHK